MSLRRISTFQLLCLRDLDKVQEASANRKSNTVVSLKVIGASSIRICTMRWVALSLCRVIKKTFVILFLRKDQRWWLDHRIQAAPGP